MSGSILDRCPNHIKSPFLMKRTSDSDLLHLATDVALIFSGQCSVLLTLMTNPRYLSFSIIISFLMTLSITHSPEQNVSVLRCLPCCLFFPPSNLVCLFLLLSVKSDCTADRPCLALVCVPASLPLCTACPHY